MKRIGNLYDKIISLENLRAADAIARRGKAKSYGLKKHDVNRDENIFSLHNILKNNQYKTSEYHIFKMVTDAGKEREIYRLPYYPDRIMHHAIMNVMEPIWVSLFTTDSYSCIKGRGIHGAMKKLKHDLNDTQNTQYCLKLDVKKFYPSINHDILKSILSKKIKDYRLLNLLSEIIDSAPGVPIGNYLSQFFANLYLTYFDHYIKEVLRVKYYYRYADDMVILAADKQSLHTYFGQINNYLNNELQLQIKENYQIFPVKARGIDFVGYVFKHTHILLRKRIKQNFARKVAKLKKRNALSNHQADQLLCSYMGWAKHCDSKNLLKKLIKNEQSTIRLATA